MDRLVQRVTCERERERTRGSESVLAERQGLAYLSGMRGNTPGQIDQWSKVCTQKACPCVCATRARTREGEAGERVRTAGSQEPRGALTSKVDFESVRIDDRDVGLDCEEGRSRFRDVFRDVTTSPREDLIDHWNAILGSLYLDEVNGLFATETKIHLSASRPAFCRHSKGKERSLTSCRRGVAIKKDE